MRVQVDKPLSFLHGLPTAVKFFTALSIVFLTALMPRKPHWVYLIPASVVVLSMILSRLPLVLGFKRLLVGEFFILGFAGLSLLYPHTLPVFWATLIKSNICVLTMVILAWTTPIHEILGLLKRIGLPAIMVTTIALLQRYFPVLLDESRRMQKARASRTFVRTRSLALDWRNLSIIAGQLFVRSAERAERIYLAMCARGWK